MNRVILSKSSIKYNKFSNNYKILILYAEIWGKTGLTKNR